MQAIERRIQLCEEIGELASTVVCTGFTCQAPKLVFSRERVACKGVVEKDGALFAKLFSPSAMRWLVADQVA